MYWYTQNDYNSNKVSLGSFLLCNILDIKILPDFYAGGRKNIMLIYVSSWFKKEDRRRSRKFYFSFNTREELYRWTMTLNFLRVKAIHDQYCLKFGIVALPLKHESKQKTQKRIKKKFKLDIAFQEPSNHKSSIDSKTSSNKSNDAIIVRKGSIEYNISKPLNNRKTTNLLRLSNISFNYDEVSYLKLK